METRCIFPWSAEMHIVRLPIDKSKQKMKFLFRKKAPLRSPDILARRLARRADNIRLGQRPVTQRPLTSGD